MRGGVRGHGGGGAGARAAEPRPGPGHGGPAAPRRPPARGAAAAAGRGGPARQTRGPVRPAARPARAASERRGLGAPGPAQPDLPQPHQQAQGVLGAAHHRVLHAGDVRRGGQRGGLQELRALVQEVGGGVEARGARPGAAGGRLPARAGALHLHRHPRPPPPRQGRLHRRAPLQPPGDQLAVQPRHPRVPPHQHRGFLDLLRVPLPAALPAGHRLLRRGGQADGGSFRATGGQELRSRDPHPPGADVPRGSPDVRGGPGPRGLCPALGPPPPRPPPPPYLFERVSAASTPLPAPPRELRPGAGLPGFVADSGFKFCFNSWELYFIVVFFFSFFVLFKPLAWPGGGSLWSQCLARGEREVCCGAGAGGGPADGAPPEPPRQFQEQKGRRRRRGGPWRERSHRLPPRLQPRAPPSAVAHFAQVTRTGWGGGGLCCPPPQPLAAAGTSRAPPQVLPLVPAPCPVPGGGRGSPSSPTPSPPPPMHPCPEGTPSSVPRGGF